MNAGTGPEEALGALAESLPDAFFVSSCGYVSRDLHACGDRTNFFYLVGSMGAALPLGLSVALCDQANKVVVIDGDGSFLMGLAALPMVGLTGPDNLVHVVLDNGVHESTGGQRTVGARRCPDLMRAAGYPTVVAARTVRHVVTAARTGHGPVGIYLPVRPRPAPQPRVQPEPAELVARSRRCLSPSTR